MQPFADRRARCLHNHAQTEQRLAARGGLGTAEALWILTDIPYKGTPTTERDALPRVCELLEKLGYLMRDQPGYPWPIPPSRPR